MKNINLLRKQNIGELNIILFSLEEKYFNLRMKFSLNKFKKTHIIKECRRNIALIKTIIYEKKKKS